MSERCHTPKGITNLCFDMHIRKAGPGFVSPSGLGMTHGVYRRKPRVYSTFQKYLF